MDLIANILGPNSEHCFIAENFVFLTWNTSNNENENKENTIFTEEEKSWLEALKCLHLNWFRSNSNKKSSTLFLPLNNNSDLLLSDSIIIHEKSKKIQFEEIPFILQARYALLQKFQFNLQTYINYDLYKKWDLFRFVQDKLFKEEKKTSILQRKK